QVEEIYLNEPNLEGELDLGDFTYEYGVKVYISPAADETKLIFKNLPEKAKISLVNAERDINYHYPTKEAREKVTKLDIRKKNLEGNLDLSDFINLKELRCSNNKLTSLNLSNCSQLEKLTCYDNQLANLTLPNNPTNLKYLDLNFLSNLKQLKKLDISNTDLNEKNTLQGLEINSEVGKLIQEYYSKTTSHRQALELIPYKELEIEKDEQGNNKVLGEGGFGKVYKAKWRKDNKTKSIVLKTLHNSQNITPEFLQEIINHKLFYKDDRIVKCHGISQDPETNEHMMVMDYIKNSDLRHYLENNQLDFKNKLDQLWKIAMGLRVIHDQNLVHHDFHAGNILNKSNKIKGDINTAVEEEYNAFSKSTPYKILNNLIPTSKLIDTKKISELISSRMSSLNLANYDSTELNIDIDIEIPKSNEIPKRLRSMSMEEAHQKETKSVKLDKITEEKEFQLEPMEIDENIQNRN
ncbi:4974_t:CDS:2, partial [Ambispora leptoticha]